MIRPARPFLLPLLAAVATAFVPPAHAAPLLVNGGFEAGLAGWTTLDQTGSEGTFYPQAGTTSPATGFSVPPPATGSGAAMSDAGAGGPGAHLLYQDFMATAGPARLSFSLYVGNRADEFHTPDTLDFATPALNQQARVDIVLASADPFSVATGDVLATLYRSQPGDPLVDGWRTISQDIGALLTAHAGEMLRLRFAETDNVNFFQLGVDEVRIAAVSEPASLALAGGALAACVASRRRLARR